MEIRGRGARKSASDVGSSPLGVRGRGAFWMVVQWLFSRKPVWRADTRRHLFISFYKFLLNAYCAQSLGQSNERTGMPALGELPVQLTHTHTHTHTHTRPRKHSEAPTNTHTHSASYSHTTRPFQRGPDPGSNPSGALRDPSELGSHCCGSAREQPSYT